MGMDFSEKQRSRRCYVKLHDPPIEIKVYADDLDYHYNCRYAPVGGTFNHRGSAVAIAPLQGSFREDVDDESIPPTFLAGEEVCIQVADYARFYGQSSRSRWIFVMFHKEGKEVEAPGGDFRIVRNSVVDRDLAQMNETAFQNDTSRSFQT